MSKKDVSVAALKATAEMEIAAGCDETITGLRTWAKTLLLSVLGVVPRWDSYEVSKDSPLLPLLQSKAVALSEELMQEKFVLSEGEKKRLWKAAREAYVDTLYRQVEGTARAKAIEAAESICSEVMEKIIPVTEEGRHDP